MLGACNYWKHTKEAIRIKEIWKHCNKQIKWLFNVICILNYVIWGERIYTIQWYNSSKSVSQKFVEKTW